MFIGVLIGAFWGAYVDQHPAPKVPVIVMEKGVI